MTRLFTPDRRRQASLIALVALVVYLLGYITVVADENRRLQRLNRETLIELAQTNDGIVAKLTEVFTAVVKAEEAARAAGVVPAQTVASVVESLRGYVDPALIQKAVDAARASVQPGAKGATGPPGPAGTSAQATTSTSTTTSSTTTSSTSSPTTTTLPPTTTSTTRPCAVGLLGLCLVR